MRLFFITSGSGSFLSHLDPDVIDGFRELQKKKKNFHFGFFRTGKTPFNQLSKKIQAFRPDVILVFIGKNSHIIQLVLPRLRKINVPTGVWVVDDPYDLYRSQRLVQPYDFVVTQETSCLPFYRRFNKPSFHIPLGVNPLRYRPLGSGLSEEYESDICFIGNAFPSRVRLIDAIASYLQKKNVLLMGKWWDRLKHYDQLKPNIINRWMPHSEAVKYYNGAKIVLNLHASHNETVARNRNHLNLPAQTPNNRTFEIAACGSFQLATRRPGFPRMFRMGSEMICYRGPRDLIRKLRYYLAHDEIRQQVAQRAYRRTLRQHTYAARLEKLVRALEDSRFIQC
ncbi:CgeB family protein [Salinithrix halophila]|uniref:Glycosyltransferase n=1 Tax=Salinithrix halophila TaxID=1485204 RepID=A0ABV8JJG1_9BACL